MGPRSFNTNSLLKPDSNREGTIPLLGRETGFLPEKLSSMCSMAPIAKQESSWFQHALLFPVGPHL